jgi:arsenite/tail-anchored protein-transporting ATPase
VTSTSRPRKSASPSRRPSVQPAFRFFAGKGGVGKTTLAAASALAGGAGALLVSTDPAHSLGDVLHAPTGPRLRRARAGRPATLELDGDAALRRWLGPRRPVLRLIAERGTYLAGSDLDALLDSSLPGLGDLIALLELRRLGEDGRFARVVVDTAPTGHTLRLLEMPDALRQLAVVLDDMQAKHRAMGQALGGRHRVDAADALVAELAQQAEDMAALLRDPERVAFTWVLDAEELALAEARDGVRALRGMGMAVDEVVVNRITPAPPRPCALCDGRRRAEAQVLRRVRAELGPAVLRTVAAREQEPRGPRALAAVGRELQRPARMGRAAARATPRPRRRAAAATPPPAWPSLLGPPGRRLLLFGGKGGAGKTTAAAAAAVELARAGRRVLLLSTDPAHSVSDALDLPLGDVESDVEGVPGLRAREIDAPAAYDARRERYRALVDGVFDAWRSRSGMDATFDRAITRDLLDMAPPGIDELFALDALTVAASDAPEAPDVVVVDTAPTGHALRLLAMPDAVSGWLRTFLGLLHRDHLAGRLPALASELVQLSRQVRRLLQLMRDRDRTAFAVVTRPSALGMAETKRLLAGLREVGMPVAALVVNGLTPAGEGCARCRRVAAREAHLVRALRRGVRGPAMLAAPLAATPPRGVAALREWAAQWRILGA